MNIMQSQFLKNMRLLVAVMLLALTGCAAIPNRPDMYRPSIRNDVGMYNGYGWNNGYSPYIYYGQPFGFGYEWAPEEESGDNGFIGGEEDNNEDGVGGLGR